MACKIHTVYTNIYKYAYINVHKYMQKVVTFNYFCDEIIVNPEHCTKYMRTVGFLWG